MATPMTLPDCCALCFHPYGDGTFDVVGPYEWVPVNVCAQCRIAETWQRILIWCGDES